MNRSEAIGHGNRNRKRALCRLSQEEVGKIFGVSRARISQLEKSALDKLRRHPVMVALAREYGLQEPEE
jgi:DNA-directed RNA polymerase sigma subunit (sigma70/sigma32)